MKAYIKYGLLAGLVSAALSLFSATQQADGSAISYILNLLTYGITAAAIFLALREKRNLQGDYLSYGQGVAEGMRTMLVAAAVVAVIQYINVKFFNREILETLHAAMEEQIENGNMSDEEMEMSQGYIKRIVSPGGLAIIMFIRTLFVGLIMSLIIAFILRKETGDNKFNNPMYGDNESNQ